MYAIHTLSLDYYYNDSKKNDEKMIFSISDLTYLESGKTINYITTQHSMIRSSSSSILRINYKAKKPYNLSLDKTCMNYLAFKLATHSTNNNDNIFHMYILDRSFCDQ